VLELDHVAWVRIICSGLIALGEAFASEI